MGSRLLGRRGYFVYLLCFVCLVYLVYLGLGGGVRQISMESPKAEVEQKWKTDETDEMDETDQIDETVVIFIHQGATPRPGGRDVDEELRRKQPPHRS